MFVLGRLDCLIFGGLGLLLNSRAGCCFIVVLVGSVVVVVAGFSVGQWMSF